MGHRTYTDQLDRQITVDFPPVRIISIVPSQTELLFDLGLDEEIIAVTKFCHHPAGRLKNRLKAGGTKNLDLDLIRNLKPDLIIGNKEENERGQIEILAREFPVWMSDIGTLPGALDMITKVGALVNRETEAKQLAGQIAKKFAELNSANQTLRVAYLIWQNPYMAVGQDTFINDMLQRCGLINVIDQSRYPEVTLPQLLEHAPDVIMLSSEPFPFKEKHAEALRQNLPKSKIILVDGELFSWYGSRLTRSPEYFSNLIELLTG